MTLGQETREASIKNDQRLDTGCSFLSQWTTVLVLCRIATIHEPPFDKRSWRVQATKWLIDRDLTFDFGLL